MHASFVTLCIVWFVAPVDSNNNIGAQPLLLPLPLTPTMHLVEWNFREWSHWRHWFCFSTLLVR